MPNQTRAFMPQTRFPSDAVSSAFAGFAQPARAHLLRLREMILETASDTPAAGRIEETLKWGQPAYLTPETRSGSTLRLGVPKTGGYAIYAHCQTSLISDFRMQFPDDFAYDGNRAVLFDAETAPDLDKLRLLVSRALTYHLR